jgi:hypothetical protein
MIKKIEEKDSVLTEKYISLHRKLKAKIAKISKEKAEME